MRQLRVDGKLLPTRRLAEAGALSRPTTSSCRWARCACTPANEPALRDLVARGTGPRQGPGAAAAVTGGTSATFSTQARLSALRHGLSRAGSAAVLLQQRARLVRDLLRHRPRAAGASMPNRPARKPPGSRRLQARRRCAGLRDLRRRAAEPAGAGGEASATCPSARLTRAAVAELRRVLRQAAARTSASRPSPRTCCAEIAQPPGIPASASASTTWGWIAPRRHSPAARRSACAWPRSSARTCAASAMCSTSPPSACIRATTRCCSMRSASWPADAIRWSWWSMTRRPSVAPTMCIDLGPGAGTPRRTGRGQRHREGPAGQPRRPSPAATCASHCSIRDRAAARRWSRAAPAATPMLRIEGRPAAQPG